MFLFLAFVALAQAAIKNCNTSSVFQITQLALVPDPPVAGEPVAMHLVFNNPAGPIENGTALSTVSLNYVPFPTSSHPLCNSTECPILSGSQDRSTKTVWPASISGAVTTKLVWMNESDVLLCIHTDFAVASISLWQAVLLTVRKRLGL